MSFLSENRIDSRIKQSRRKVLGEKEKNLWTFHQRILW
jgi:hypothetical protein